jgi:cytochrome c2
MESRSWGVKEKAADFLSSLRDPALFRMGPLASTAASGKNADCYRVRNDMKVANLVLTVGAVLSLAACGSEKEEAAPGAELAPDAVPVETAAPAAGAPAIAAEQQKEAEAAPAAPAAAADAAPAQAEVAAAGPPQGFLICSSCHAVEPGKNGIGPSLAGLYGKKAASVAGYSYSEPLKKANITWTDAALDKWLEAPMKMVPGTRMVFGGIPDAAKRKELIDYMKSL